MTFGAQRDLRRAQMAEMVAEIPAYQSWLLLRCKARQANAWAAMVRRYLWASGDDWASAAGVQRHLAGLRAGGTAIKTVHNVRTGLSQFFEFLGQPGGSWARLATAGIGNPCRAVKLPAIPRRVPRWLSTEEIAAVLEAARARGIWPEITLAIYGGLRLGELGGLQWIDVDLGGRTVTIRDPKEARDKIVPLCELCVAALEFQRGRAPPERFRWVFPGRRTFPGGWRYEDRRRAEDSFRELLMPVRAVCPKFLQAVGVGRGWHLLRHTYASQAAAAGVPMKKLAAWMGHSDSRITERVYAHLADGYDPDVERIGGAGKPEIIELSNIGKKDSTEWGD